MPQVAIHALQILNELITMDFKALGSTALLSVVLVVAKYAAGVGPAKSQDTRLHAAYFLQFLSQTNLLTAQLLVTCQVHRKIDFPAASLGTPVPSFLLVPTPPLLAVHPSHVDIGHLLSMARPGSIYAMVFHDSSPASSAHGEQKTELASFQSCINSPDPTPI